MTREILVSMRGIRKRFGNVVALDGVDLDIYRGEILGLLGENGAGKTTLMNILFGLYKLDEGEIYIKGEKVSIRSPEDAIRHGIFMVHQHFKLIGNFTVLENIVLGTVKGSKSLKPVELKDARATIEKLMDSFGIKIDLDAKIRDLSVGDQQKVEILKALYRKARLLILDEPTTNLAPQEVDSLFNSIREMVARGMSVVFITHKIKEALSIADRIAVLRNGKNMGVLDSREATEDLLVELMVGTRLGPSITATSKTTIRNPERRVLLKLSSVSLVESGIAKLSKINLEVREGEILGVAGVSGNGQRELAEVIMGIRKPTSGKIEVLGLDVTGMKTPDIIAMGVGYIPEDRLVDGILPTMSLAENIILGYHRLFARGLFKLIDYEAVRRESREAIARYRIVAPDENVRAGRLSGGNIQKLLIARTLSRKPKVLVAHNMTRGLDIATTNFILKELLDLKSRGTAILYISEDLDELMTISDRIAVMYKGRIVRVFEKGEFDKYSIGRMMMGVTGA